MGIAGECGVERTRCQSEFEVLARLLKVLLLILCVTEVVERLAIVGIGLVGILHIFLQVAHGALVVAADVLCFGKPQSAFVQNLLIVVAHLDSLLQIVGSFLAVALLHRLHAQVVEHILLSLQNGGTWILDVFDTGERALVVVGGVVELHKVLFHRTLIGGVWELVEEVLKEFDVVAKRSGATLALAHGVVVVGVFLHLSVEVHARRLLKRQSRQLAFAQFELALTDVEVGALCHVVGHVGHLTQVLHGVGVVGRVEVHHTQCVRCRAHQWVLCGGNVFIEVLAGLGHLVFVVVTLTHKTMNFGSEIVVHLIAQQRFAQRNHTVVVLVVEVDLTHVVLALVAQFASTVDVGELGVGGIIVLVGVVDVSVVETGGIVVAACAFQRFVEVASLGILLKLKVAVSHAVNEVFIHVAVERTLAHLAVGSERIAIFAMIEVEITNPHQHIGHQFRSGIVGGECSECVKSPSLIAFEAAQSHVIVSLLAQGCT